jgi:hypothetical protein
MTTKQNPFLRSDLNEELRLLLGAERGIQDAENLRPRLPLLGMHPAVVAHTPQSGARKFQRGLECVLGKAIELSGESTAMQKAVRWHLVLDQGDVLENAKDREKRACEIAGSKKLNKYSKDRPPGQQRPDLTIALESVEAQLEALGQASLGRPRVKVGGVEIPDVFCLATCSQGQDATHEMTLEFEDTPRDGRPDCEAWPLLSAYLLNDLKREAKDQGRTFRPGPALDLLCAEELEPEVGAPRRYRVGVAETDYNRWVATANSLDRDLSRYRELTERLGSSTLRQAWGHTPDCLEDIAELPAPCFMGVCVVVVVENHIIALPRQRMHLVAGSESSSADRSTKPTPVHFVGEGVVPDDLIAGRTPPESAALRGCYEELKLAEDELDLIPTAFVFDTLRWQPLFCYLAHCKLTMPEVETRMKKAMDSQETGQGQIAALLQPTVVAPDTRALLTGSHPSMRLASNHAEIALLYALVYTDGLERVASETL